MIWNVFVYGHQTGAIEVYNIFNHTNFKSAIEKLLATDLTKDREAFSKKVDEILLYYFWSKCNYEIVLTNCYSNFPHRKVDVYEQISINLTQFINYILSFKEED